MVTRKRFRTVLNALALYTMAALVIGYFGVNAYSGNRGLRAKQDLDQQIAQLSGELAGLRAERGTWERRVSLLRPEIPTCSMSVPGHCSTTPIRAN